MRIEFTLIALLLFGVSVFSQTECEKFKIGKFQNIENGVVKSTIERSESIQTERHGRLEVKLKIEWIDDCSYRLKFIDGNEAFWNSRPKDMATPDLIVRITHVNGNSYLQESNSEDDSDFIYRSKMEKI
jgi:hypothetical protein